MNADDLYKMALEDIRASFDPNKPREQYEAGDKSALIGAMFAYAGLRLPVPLWIAEALRNAALNPPQSWDDLFGSPRPKGRGERAQRRARIEKPVLELLWHLYLDGRAIDKGLFADVGEAFEISASTVERIYSAQDHKSFFCSLTFRMMVAQEVGHEPTEDEMLAWYELHKDWADKFANNFWKEVRAVRRSVLRKSSKV